MPRSKITRHGKAVAGISDLAKDAVQKNSDQLTSFLDEAMGARPAGSASNLTVRSKREIGFAMGRLFAPGADINSGENRTALVKALTEAGMTEAESNKLIASWTESYNKLKADLAEAKAAAEQKALAAADVAARKFSKAAFYSFFAFWIGAILASVGGVAGARCAHAHLTVFKQPVSD